MRKKSWLIPLFCLWIMGIHATVLRVNNTTGSTAPYPDLMTAYEAAAEGDTIYLEGSVTNYELKDGFAIEKSLTICGTGYYLTENAVTSCNQHPSTIGTRNATLKIKASNVVLRGVSMYKLALTSVQNVVINRCRIQGAVILDETTANCAFHQNKIEAGFEAYNASNILLTNNIMDFFMGDATNTYSINNLKSSTLKYNHIRCYNIQGMENCILKNNLLDSKNMTGSQNNSLDSSNYTGDWRSECVNAAGSSTIDSDYRLSDNSGLATKDNGKPIGAFGGTDPYVISGIPNIPLIRDLQIPASATTDEGLEVTVKITTGQ